MKKRQKRTSEIEVNSNVERISRTTNIWKLEHTAKTEYHHCHPEHWSDRITQVWVWSNPERLATLNIILARWSWCRITRKVHGKTTKPWSDLLRCIREHEAGHQLKKDDFTHISGVLLLPGSKASSWPLSFRSLSWCLNTLLGRRKVDG